MTQALPFFIVLLIGVVFSALVGRFHVPWVVALILGGIAVGPYGLDVVPTDATLEFMGEMGLVFLMFMAGLETKLSTLSQVKKNIAVVVLLNSLIPFLAAYALGVYLGLSTSAVVLLGIVFMSSSVAVVVPMLESSGLLQTRLGRLTIGAMAIEDIVGLMILTILLQFIEPNSVLPVPVFYILLVSTLVMLRWLIPRVQTLMGPHNEVESHIFQQDVRVIFAILIGTVVLFEILGVHSIVAGFFTGLIFSESIRSEILLQKIHTLSYGFFIPIFFVLLGVQMDIGMLVASKELLIPALVMVGVAFSAKLVSGFIGGKLSGFTASQSVLIGATTTPLLSTSLAATLTGARLGLITPELMTSIVAVSILTTLLGPLLVLLLTTRVVKETPF